MSGRERIPEGDALASALYDELRRVAGRMMVSEREGHTLQPTALVHEAFLRLRGQDREDWQNDEHFVAVAATMMRRILVDHARNRGAAKRGGGRQRTTLVDHLAVTEAAQVDLLALDEALDRLAELDPGLVRLIELRFFGGLTEVQAAHVLGVSERKTRQEWAFARGWLRRELDVPPANP